MDIGTFFLEAIWFGLPAGVANMAPVLAAKLFPSLNYPLDANIMWRGKRLLGDHKTVRGLIAGIILGALVFLLQKNASNASPFAHLSWIEYSTLPWYTGGIFGFGALIGDAIKSILKRQLGIAPGKPWVPFDQSDWIIGMFIAISPWIRIPIPSMAGIFGIGILLHLLSKVIGKFLRLNRTYI